MILRGWKQIAEYLGCGIRTAQRWQKDGLPVQRLSSGSRAHVAADSEQLAYWVRDSSLRRGSHPETLANVERARKLRREVKQARETLHLKMEALRRGLDALRSRGRHAK